MSRSAPLTGVVAVASALVFIAALIWFSRWGRDRPAGILELKLVPEDIVKVTIGGAAHGNPDAVVIRDKEPIEPLCSWLVSRNTGWERYPITLPIPDHSVVFYYNDGTSRTLFVYRDFIAVSQKIRGVDEESMQELLAILRCLTDGARGDQEAVTKPMQSD